jgi:hypothetical protein
MDEPRGLGKMRMDEKHVLGMRKRLRMVTEMAKGADKVRLAIKVF